MFIVYMIYSKTSRNKTFDGKDTLKLKELRVRFKDTKPT